MNVINTKRHKPNKDLTKIRDKLLGVVWTLGQ